MFGVPFPVDLRVIRALFIAGLGAPALFHSSRAMRRSLAPCIARPVVASEYSLPRSDAVGLEPPGELWSRSEIMQALISLFRVFYRHRRWLGAPCGGPRRLPARHSGRRSRHPSPYPDDTPMSLRRANPPPPTRSGDHPTAIVRMARRSGRRGSWIVVAALLGANGSAATGSGATGSGVPGMGQKPPPEPALEAAWIDRTREQSVGGWLVRSDLDRRTSAELLDDLASLGREFTRSFGEVGGRLRVWMFESGREAARTIRTRFGSEFDPDEGAAFVEDPVAGRSGLIVVAPRGTDATAFRQSLARAVASFGVASKAEAPPWLVHGVVEWFVWSQAPETRIEGVRPPASLRMALRQSFQRGQRFGADRLIRLDDEAWAANRSAGSGPLQHAEAGMLVAAMLEAPVGGAGIRRLLEQGGPAGAAPDRIWSVVWPGVLPANFDRSIDRMVQAGTSVLEGGLREAAWLASGRASRLASAGDLDEVGPATLRDRLVAAGAGVVEPCLSVTGPATGWCRGEAPPRVIEWDEIGEDAWIGRAGPWRITLSWRRFGDLGGDGDANEPGPDRTRWRGMVSFERASEVD